MTSKTQAPDNYGIEVVYDWSIHKWKVQTFEGDKWIAVESYMHQQDAVINAFVDVYNFEKKYGFEPRLKMEEKSGATARFTTPHAWIKLAKQKFEEQNETSDYKEGK
jgi:hypothetical protein